MTEPYQQTLARARGSHDPDRYDGRTWEELGLWEQEAALTALAESVTEEALGDTSE